LAVNDVDGRRSTPWMKNQDEKWRLKESNIIFLGVVTTKIMDISLINGGCLMIGGLN
jgi:hypothetical protein